MSGQGVPGRVRRRATSGLPRAANSEAAAAGRELLFGASGRRRRSLRTWPAAARQSRAALLAATRAQEAELQLGVERRRRFLALMGAILAVSVLVFLLGAGGLLGETRSRPLTPVEQQRYQQEEIARRWQAWPAAAVFPEEVQYFGLGHVQQYARRVGIAPESGCARATDAAVGSVLTEHGCRTMLRATYLDQTATFAVTVGVAVLADEEARVAAAEKLAVDDRVGVRPVSFPGTVTERFGQAQRQRNSWVGAGPYLVFTTVGYTDGRTRAAVPPEEILHSELWPTAKAIGAQLAYFLSEPPKAPRCTQGNVC